MLRKKYIVTKRAAWFEKGEVVYISHDDGSDYPYYSPVKPHKIGDKRRDKSVIDHYGWCMAKDSCMEWKDTIKIGGEIL